MTIATMRPPHGEPKHEYQTEAKAQYREAVWSAFAENVPDVATAKVLFFPGRHGLEIPVALAHGFKEENLIACDENAAIIASAKWHKEYPLLRCYGTSLSRTINRLAQEGIQLDAVNLDYCSNLCAAVLADIRLLIDSGVLNNDRSVLAITLLKGREDTALIDVAKLVFSTTNGTADRVGIVKAFVESLHIDCEVVQRGEYRSASKNMVFGALAMNGLERALQKAFPAFHESKKGDYEAVLTLLQGASNEGENLDDSAAWDKADSIMTDIRAEESELRHQIATRFNLRRKDGSLKAYFAGLPICPTALAAECDYQWHNLSARYQDACLAKMKREGAELRERYALSQRERAQLLQAGRAYR